MPSRRSRGPRPEILPEYHDGSFRRDEQGFVASYDTVFLCNPGTLSDQAGGLKILCYRGWESGDFPGPKTDPAAWKKSAALTAFLPATPVAPENRGETVGGLAGGGV